MSHKLDDGQIECPDEAMIKLYRQKTPLERIKIASDMWDSAWEQVKTTLRSLHPDWNDKKIHKEVIRRLAHESH